MDADNTLDLIHFPPLQRHVHHDTTPYEPNVCGAEMGPAEVGTYSLWDVGGIRFFKSESKIIHSNPFRILILRDSVDSFQP